MKPFWQPPPPPPGSGTTIGWVQTSERLPTVCLWPKGRSSNRVEPHCGKKKEKTEQRGLLSCLCVLTNQRQHAESLSQSPCRGLSATWPAVQAGYHLGGPSGSTEKGSTGGISEWTKQADTGERTQGVHIQEGVTKRTAQAPLTAVLWMQEAWR